jgi:hypothetical protein
MQRYYSRGVAQVVSNRLFAAGFWVRSQGSPCGICDEENGTGTVFTASYSYFSCRYHPARIRFFLSVSFHRYSIFIHVSSGGWTKGLLAAAVSWIHSLTPSQEKCNIIYY